MDASPLPSPNVPGPHARSRARRLALAGAALCLAGLGAAGAYGLTAGLLRAGPAPAQAALSPHSAWAVSAPGRVEPSGGDVRISAAIVGRLAEVLVSTRDRVEAGELLMRIEDAEHRARLAAAEAEADARRRERDAQSAGDNRDDVRRAEDAVYFAERNHASARMRLDYVLSQRRATGTTASLDQARRALDEATQRLAADRIAHARASQRAGLQAPSRLETAVTAARAEVSAAQVALDRTRIRSPIAGSVLQLPVKAGELLAPGMDAPAAVVGNIATLTVRAEVDDRDVAQVVLGQRVILRALAYPGQDFEGTVTARAPHLAPPRIANRGPRRASDVEVLEVTIELKPGSALLPGMRVDAFFHAATVAQR